MSGVTPSTTAAADIAANLVVAAVVETKPVLKRAESIVVLPVEGIPDTLTAAAEVDASMKTDDDTDATRNSKKRTIDDTTTTTAVEASSSSSTDATTDDQPASKKQKKEKSSTTTERLLGLLYERGQMCRKFEAAQAASSAAESTVSGAIAMMVHLGALAKNGDAIALETRGLLTELEAAKVGLAVALDDHNRLAGEDRSMPNLVNLSPVELVVMVKHLVDNADTLAQAGRLLLRA